jgi:hypothetical protein
MSEPRHRAIARIQLGAVPRRLGQRIMITIILPDRVPVVAIAFRAPEALDPRLFIRRHGLAGQLSTDPVCFLSQDNAHAVSQSSHGGRAAAYSASYNGNIGVHLGRCQAS